MMPWGEYYLKELTTKIGSGATPTGGSGSYKSFGIPLIRSQNVLDYAFSNRGLVLIDENQALALKNVIVEENDILLNITGDSVARVCKVPKELTPARVNQHVAIIRANKKVLNPDFLLYYLQSKKENLLILSEIGGTRNALTKAMIEEFKIETPPILQQNEIASILSHLDDKIDLLNRQNKTLEELTEIIFRHSLIDNLGENWSYKPLGTLIENTFGGEWGKEVPDTEYQLKVQCIRGTDISDLEIGIPLKTPIRYIKHKKFKSIEIKSGDLIMEISGGTDNQSTGRTTYINEHVMKLFRLPLIFSNFCRLIRPIENKYCFYLYALIHHLYKQGDLFNLENGSSGIKNLNYKALLFDLKFKIADEILISRFNEEVTPIFDKININKFQILSLTKLRDQLNNKLMNRTAYVLS